MSYYTEVAAPTVYPATLDEVKDWAKIDGIDSDARAQAILQAATKLVEHWLNRPLISRQFDLTMDKFPSVISIGKLPVQSVDSITYFDEDNASQVLSASLYKVSLGNTQVNCRIQPAVNQSWPNIYDDLDVVVVRLTAGYGTSWNDIPQSVRTGLLFVCVSMVDNACFTDKDQMHINSTAAGLLNSERLGAP